MTSMREGHKGHRGHGGHGGHGEQKSIKFSAKKPSIFQSKSVRVTLA